MVDCKTIRASILFIFCAGTHPMVTQLATAAAATDQKYEWHPNWPCLNDCTLHCTLCLFACGGLGMMQHFSSLCVVFYCCCSSFYSNHHQARHSTIRVTELYDCTASTIIIYRNSQYNLSICRGAHDTCSRWHFWNCTLKPRLVGWFSRAVAAAFRGGTSSRRRNNPCSSTVVLRRIIKPNDHPQILPPLPARCPYSTLTRPTTLAFAFCDCGDFKHIEISFCAFIGLRFWRHKTWPWPRERASLCRWNCLLSCPYSVHQNRDRQTSPRARKQT